MLSDEKINAIVKLLDDDDVEIWDNVRGTILNCGPDIIPKLELHWENSLNILVQERLEELIQTIHFNSIKSDLVFWKKTGGFDLLEGCLLVAKFQYPDLDVDKINTFLSTLKQEVWHTIKPTDGPLDKVKIINYVLFEVHNFNPNLTNFHAPNNSFINNVLESKKGNPLSLSIVYLLIAQGLNIPIFGINLPEHFVVAYTNASAGILPEHSEVLFYINPFRKGTIFGQPEIEDFFKQLKLTVQSQYILPCNNIEIIKRTLRNLVNAFAKQENKNKVTNLLQLIEILEDTKHDV